MIFLDSQGNEIKVGLKAKIRIGSVEIKTGKVKQVIDCQITLRCKVSSNNPDGVLFGRLHKDITILNLA